MIEVITSHINTDFDGLAAMLAARHLYPQAEMVLPGSPERSLHNFFLHSCGYAYPFKRLKDVDLEEIGRLIVVDTRQKSRIGPFAEVAARLGVEVVVYDHHPASDDDLQGVAWCEVAEVGAVVTLLAEKLREKNLALAADEATLMMIGLYEDTGSLTFQGTTGRDFQAGAWLLEQGANLETVAEVINNPLDREQVSLLNDLLSSQQTIYPRGQKVVLVEATREHYIADVAMVVHRLRDIERAAVVIALLRLDDKVYLIGRSRSPALDVGHLLAHFGGGGHHTAAAAVTRELTLIQCRERLLALLEKEVVPPLRAVDLMTAPVLTITPATTLAGAAALLTRYNINVLPVIEENSARLVGIISRQVVEKALFHGLKDLAVSEYMTTDYEPIAPEADISRIKELIIGRNQRFLPVIDEAQTIVGAITRKDLLRALYELEGQEVTGFRSVEDGDPKLRRKNVNSLMSESFPAELRSVFRRLGELADEIGVNTFLVGGVVRDLLLRRANLDIDIVVEGDGIALARAYSERYRGRCHCHEPFRTAVLMTAEGYKLDIASTRMEYYDAPATLPIVEQSSLKVDLYRRDFTINTLVVSLNRQNYGEMRDYFGAGRDLKERSIRVLHNLSFVEDPTRIFRAIRFEQKFSFTIGRQTLHLINNAIKVGFVRRLSGARILHELKLICAEPDPLPVFFRISELKLWGEIFPELKGLRRAQPRQNLLLAAKEVVAWYEYLFLEERLEIWRVYFLCFLDGMSAAQAHYCALRLGFDDNAGQRFVNLRRRGIEAAAELGRLCGAGRVYRNSELCALLEALSLEILLYIMAGHQSQSVKRALSSYITRLQFVEIEINGNDLIAAGLLPGPYFKEILNRVREARLDGEVNNRQEELALVAGLKHGGTRNAEAKN
ncbi:MAG: CBS domain-containing protein [Deltaproteobacteria bacterium]|nr:CBS domain-containing protein [Deltaproteobacteria bacterium]